MPTLDFYLLCGGLRSSGVTEWRNDSLGLHDSFSAVNENVDEYEISFSAEKPKTKT